jgi:hypothetical protein
MTAVWKLLALLAVLVMPLGMTPAAAVPAHHAIASQTMPVGHCPDQDSSHHQMKGGIAECTMACAAALPAAELARHDAVTIMGLPAEPAIALRLHGLHPETATPPPKRA